MKYSKSIILSVNRPFTDYMMSGNKKIEVRTIKPVVSPPYRVYVYETKRNGGCGQVIGFFDCIGTWLCTTYCDEYDVDDELLSYACLSYDDLVKYGRRHGHLHYLNFLLFNEFVSFDIPRSLNSFGFSKPPQNFYYFKE